MRQKMCCLLVGLFPSSCPQVNHSSHFALKQTQTMLVSVTCCRMYSHMDLLVGPSHARLVQTRADRWHNPRVFHQGVYGYGTLVSIRLLLTLNNFWPFFFPWSSWFCKGLREALSTRIGGMVLNVASNCAIRIKRLVSERFYRVFPYHLLTALSFFTVMSYVGKVIYTSRGFFFWVIIWLSLSGSRHQFAQWTIIFSNEQASKALLLIHLCLEQLSPDRIVLTSSRYCTNASDMQRSNANGIDSLLP